MKKLVEIQTVENEGLFMNDEEYVTHLINYLCEIGKYQEFEEYLKSLGYSQDDIDDV